MENCLVNVTGKSQYQNENQELANFITDKMFYRFWDKNVTDKASQNLELIISPKCNLACKYCYVNRYHDKLFDEDCFNEEKTLSNLKLICEWLKFNNWNPDLEIFSGELFAQEVGYKVFDVLIDYYASVDPSLRCKNISMPTNFTFLSSKEATARIDEIRSRLKALDIDLYLSASFDGKYMEQNRPYKGNIDIDLSAPRDDEYYDRAFDYCAKWAYGFHPMVYSQGIELWPKNFDWFQSKFKEYDIPWECIYLLQVRNMEWSQQQIKDMQFFIEYLYKFVIDQFHGDPIALTKWVVEANGFNMLSQPYVTVGRGLTCGIQNQYALRVSDLMCYPCHRTGYKDFYFGQYVPDEKQVLKYVNTNVELLAATYYVHKEGLPYCSQCPINRLCQGTCLGAQYEATGNMFTPIPSVCALTYAMIATNLKCLKKYGSFGTMCAYEDTETINQLLYLERATNV